MIKHIYFAFQEVSMLYFLSPNNEPRRADTLKPG